MKSTFLFCLVVLFSALSISRAETVSPLHLVKVETKTGLNTWKVELASDDESRTKGLMFRKQMDRDAGMLFRFDRVQMVSMWMKNTFLPLDMIFLTGDGTISSIHHGAVPHSLDIISSRDPVRFVLEINAGEAKRVGLDQGQVMLHPWFEVSD